MTEHQHRPLPIQSLFQALQPFGRAAQRQMEHRQGQARQGELAVLPHIHDLD